MNLKLLTREGHSKLSGELDYLWKKERPEITQIVTWAANQGDRSENADYHYNKKRLREIDRRIRFLTKLLEDCKIVEYHPDQEDRVFFGAWVELIDENTNFLKFRIVGSEEIYGQKDYISVDSPMAKSCLRKSVDDEIEVDTPAGKKYWVIKSIEYIAP